MIREVFGIFKDTFVSWNKDHAQRLGAALAYYAVFSLGPLLIIVIAVAGLVFGQAAAQGQIMGQIQDLVGEQGASFIQAAIASAGQPRASLAASIVGLATLLLAAIGLFGQLQDALNTIWDVKPKPNRGLLGPIQDRVLSFAMVLVVGLLLLASLVFSAGQAAFSTYVGNRVPFSASVALGVNSFASLVVIAFLFALIFKYLPDAVIPWRHVWLGAALTSLLFAIGKYVLGFYLDHSTVGSSYGAAGSLIIVLVWIYYSAQILLFGAEFTKVFATRYGRGIVPAPNAVRAAEGVRT